LAASIRSGVTSGSSSMDGFDCANAALKFVIAHLAFLVLSPTHSNRLTEVKLDAAPKPLARKPASNPRILRNACRTDDHVSCAIHVTWTRRYRVIRDQKPLIYMAFRGVSISARNGSILPMRKPANALTWQAFILVAGARNLLYRTRTEWRRRIKRPLLQPVV
jgi:hypothetical protein